MLSVVVMGPGQKLLTQVGSGQSSMVLVLVWKISPKNVKIFNFFPSVKKNLFGSGQKVPARKAGRPLIYYRSKASSGWVRGYL